MQIRHKIIISWLLFVATATTVAFAWYARTSPESARERSLDAEVRLFVEYGATVGDVYHTWTVPRPQNPILDLNGDVSPTSCGPHIDLSKLNLDPATFDELVPTLRQLIPRDGCSHVAIYVHSETPGRTTIVRTAASKLPHCVVFNESQHISNRVTNSVKPGTVP